MGASHGKQHDRRDTSPTGRLTDLFARPESREEHDDNDVTKPSPLQRFLGAHRGESSGAATLAERCEQETADAWERWEALAGGEKLAECHAWFAALSPAGNHAPYTAGDVEDGVCAAGCFGDTFPFGKFSCRSDQAFFLGRLSMAVVNLRPLVPGHVLVISRRKEARVADLSDAELCDLWRTARLVQAALEIQNPHATSGFNLAIQDGYAAGQSVPHVHIHLIPRTRGDFARTDEVYDKLEEFEYKTQPPAPQPAMGAADSAAQASAGRGARLTVPDDSERRDRSEEVMASEAGELRLALIHVAHRLRVGAGVPHSSGTATP